MNEMTGSVWLKERLGSETESVVSSSSPQTLQVFPRFIYRKLYSSLASGSIPVHQQEDTKKRNQTQPRIFGLFLSLQCPSVPHTLGKEDEKHYFVKFKAPQRFLNPVSRRSQIFSLHLEFWVIFLLLSVIKHSSTLLSNLIPVFLSARVQFHFNLPC